MAINLSSLAALLSHAGFAGGVSPPALRPIPTRPLPLPGMTPAQQARLFQAWQRQVERIEASNAQLMAQFHQQRQTFQAGLFGVGLGGIQGGLGQLAGTPITTGSVGGGIAKIVGGVGTIAGGLIGGPGGAALGAAFGELLKAAAGAADGLKNFSSNLLATNFQFAEFSPAMSRVEARFEADQIRLSHARGERLAVSAENLRSGTQGFREGIAYIEDQLTRFANNTTGAVASSPITSAAVGGLGGFWVQMLGLLTNLNDKMEAGSQAPYTPWLEDMYKDRVKDVYETYGRPPRFGP